MVYKCLRVGFQKDCKIKGQSDPTYPILAVQSVKENQSYICFVLMCICFIFALQAIYITLKINLVLG